LITIRIRARARGRADIDAVEPLLRPSDEPVEQAADRRELLLDGRRRGRPGLPFDPRGHVQRLHRGERAHAGGAPYQEIPGRPRVRAPRVQVAERRGEELEEAHTGTIARRDYQRRRGHAADSSRQVDRLPGHDQYQFSVLSYPVFAVR
jgi:hypothetical protein